MENPISTNPPQNEVKNGEKSCFTHTGSAIFSKNGVISALKSAENGAEEGFSQENKENSKKALENQGNQPLTGQNSTVLEENSKENSQNARANRENSAKSSEGSTVSQENISKTAENGAKAQENSASAPDNSASAPEKQPNELNLLSEDNIKAFGKDFPGVDIEKIRTNQGFSALLTAIMHNPSLSSVYSCFNSIVSAAEESSRGKILHALATLDASVGSLSSSQPSDSGYFTKEQVMKMSREEVKQNLDKIRASQSNW